MEDHHHNAARIVLRLQLCVCVFFFIVSNLYILYKI